MNVGTMLNDLVIGPLKLLFEVLFSFINRFADAGLSVVLLSLTVNLLALPLFARARTLRAGNGEEAAETGGREKRSLLHGKAGRTLLRAVKGFLPLILQIPFLIAAWQLLSGLGCLRGAAFGPIRDLSRPDEILGPGGGAVHLLPLVMTGLQILSAAADSRASRIYRILTVCEAAVFLLFLYGAPAGVTLFWTLNNLFALGRDLIQDRLARGMDGKRRRGARLPGFFRRPPQPRMFFLFALLLTLLTGLMIPSRVISASPQEFIESVSDPDPFWYVVGAFLLSAGTFLLWLGICYAAATPAAKRGMELGAWVLFAVFLVNDLFFRGGLGTMSNLFRYDVKPEFTAGQKILNLAVLLLAAAGAGLFCLKKESWVRGTAAVLALSMTGMSGVNAWMISGETMEARRVLERNYEGPAEIPISREGRNVAVIMLDRAISSYLPCILQEKPELKEVFSGFTYYPNTASFGMHTILGAPPLFGGYEYTPSEMNARDTEPLRDKHNEALMLLPTLFSGQGARVTLFDMPYPGNYTELGDYSVFDSLPDTNARIIRGVSGSEEILGEAQKLRMRNLFCYSLTMTAPTAVFGSLYNMGNYNLPRQTPELPDEDAPLAYDVETVTPGFRMDYETLRSLGKMTRIQEGNQDTLLMMVNCMTHQPTLLQEPDYVMAPRVDNAAYDEAHRDRFLAGPLALNGFSDYQMAHYHVNMAALLMIGDWIEQLKAAGVYGNTRIILVSDHGFWLQQIREGILPETGEDIMEFNPLLMVKDFGAEGPVRTDNTFMTNADVPVLALDRIVENPVNPFTGKPVTGAAKEKELPISISHEYTVGRNKGNAFPPSEWYMLKPGGETLFDLSRWTLTEGTR